MGNRAPPILFIMTVLSACAVVLAALQSTTAIDRSCWDFWVIESLLLRRRQPRQAVTGHRPQNNDELRFGCRGGTEPQQ